MKKLTNLMFILLTILSLGSCSNSSGSDDEVAKKKIIVEVTKELDKFYAIAKVFNVDSLMTFFNKSTETVQIVNGKSFSLDEFRMLLQNEYSLRKSQKFIFESPVIEVISEDAVLVITKKRNEFELKTGGNVAKNTTETFLWRKINGKWLVDLYYGIITAV